MGYCVSSMKSKVFIKNEVKKEAFEALKKFTKQKQNKNESLTWVYFDEILEAESLGEALENCRWEVSVDDLGNIDELEFIGEKLGDELEIFNSIASYFNEGSYIEMSGEDGDIWRYLFKDGECKEIHPKITWEE